MTIHDNIREDPTEVLAANRKSLKPHIIQGRTTSNTTFLQPLHYDNQHDNHDNLKLKNSTFLSLIL